VHDTSRRFKCSANIKMLSQVSTENSGPRPRSRSRSRSSQDVRLHFSDRKYATDLLERIIKDDQIHELVKVWQQPHIQQWLPSIILDALRYAQDHHSPACGFWLLNQENERYLKLLL
jgi:hypothetical protein